MKNKKCILKENNDLIDLTLLDEKNIIIQTMTVTKEEAKRIKESWEKGNYSLLNE